MSQFYIPLLCSSQLGENEAKFRSMFKITGLQILNLFTTGLDKVENRETEREQETEGGEGQGTINSDQWEPRSTAVPLKDNGSTSVTTTWSSSPLWPRRTSLLVLQLIGQPVQALVQAVAAGGAGGLDVPVAVA